MNYDSWAEALVIAAKEWASSNHSGINDIEKTGFVMGAQGKPCPYVVSEDFSMFDMKVYQGGFLAGQRWVSSNPMPVE